MKPTFEMEVPNLINPTAISGDARHRVYENVQQVIDEQISYGASEEPVFIIDVQAILKAHANWLAKLPRVTPYYAVKCNPLPIMVETLASLGCNFDCASKTEIETVLSCGVSADRIIYANPCKTRSYIRHAAQVGVDMMTFDNEDELIKISKLFPNSKLVLRIKVDDSFSVCKFSAKFGASIPEAYRLLGVAKNLNLNVIGVSFHVGSGCESTVSFAYAIRDAKNVFSYAESIGFQMNLLNLGGGYPGTSNAPVTFDEIAETVNKELDYHFPESMQVQVIAEPGRYFAASAFTLITQVIAKRPITYDEEEIASNLEQLEREGGPVRYSSQGAMPRAENMLSLADTLMDQNIEHRRGVMYYLNDGVYGSFNCTLFDHWTVHPEPYALRRTENGNMRLEETDQDTYLNTILWGPTCDSMDMIRRDIYLPELQIGDFIVFREMGAYTVAAATTFNGFQLPKLRYYMNGETLASIKSLPTWPRLKHLLRGHRRPKFMGNVENSFESSNEVHGNGERHDIRAY